MLADPSARALLSLDGLSVGDALGEALARAGAVPGWPSRLPAPPWRFTDDTVLATGVVAALRSDGRIRRHRLAARFAERYRRDRERGFGITSHTVLQAIGAGTDWRVASAACFDGCGSMGNGAAMRVAPLGAWFAGDLPRVVAEARRSAQVTHAHAEAQAGAIAVAVAAALAVSSGAASGFLEEVLEQTPAGVTRDGLRHALALDARCPPAQAAAVLGNGARVCAHDTVPFALWCAARHLHDYASAVRAAAGCGGDVDTLCAIAGGVVVLASGTGGIPAGWLAARESLAGWL